ncbi:response regulator, partial [Vibrio parahaemolyticus V-223/04]
VWVA